MVGVDGLTRIWFGLQVGVPILMVVLELCVWVACCCLFVLVVLYSVLCVSLWRVGVG